MSTLDRQKPYGEVWGDADGKRYFQNDKYFDSKGDEIGGAKPAAKPEPAKTAPAPAPAKTAVDDQLSKQ